VRTLREIEFWRSSGKIPFETQDKPFEAQSTLALVAWPHRIAAADGLEHA